MGLDLETWLLCDVDITRLSYDGFEPSRGFWHTRGAREDRYTPILKILTKLHKLAFYIS